MTPAQLRAARALLDWTRNDLKDASGISPETIKNIETGKFKPQKATIDKIINTFAERGVEFMGHRQIQGVMLISTSLTEKEIEQ
jgi:predicted transcriptional regulator